MNEVLVGEKTSLKIVKVREEHMSDKIGNTWLSTEKYVYKPLRAIQDNQRMLDMIAEEEIEDLD